MSLHFDTWQWTLLLLGAFFAGLSKTGVPGLSVLFIALFNLVLPSRVATGVVLPLLILGDVFGVASYRKHLVWSHLWRLFPWTVAGVVLGWLALGRLDDAWVRRMIGAILLLMIVVNLWRRRRGDAAAANASSTFAAGTGLGAGFCTLVANAAGPVMNLYLLAMRLPKLEFLGTGAIFFLLLNWFKVPFMVNLGLINGQSLHLNLFLAPALVVGALAGRWVAGHIPQRLFENTAFALTVVAAVKLLVG